LHSLAASGAWLLLLEVTREMVWVDLTFGLTEGWWRFTDTDLRRLSPLLPPASWTNLLTAVGFEHAAAGPALNGDSHSRGAVILARRPDPSAAQAAARPCWILFADMGGVGLAFEHLLRAHGEQVFVVGRSIGSHGPSAPDRSDIDTVLMEAA